MERIETSKLNRELGKVLVQVAQGKSFILTRYGKDVAALVPPVGVAGTIVASHVEDGVTVIDDFKVTSVATTARESR